jgi:phospholipase/carboxylesterase
MFKSIKSKIGELDCIIATASNQHPAAAVILCHGFGAPGTDLVPVANEMIATNSALNDAMFVFPAAPIELEPMFDARAWWPIDIEKIQYLMMTGAFRELRNSIPSELSSCRQMINTIIGYLIGSQNLTSRQIIVGGFSQGAMLTTDVALNFEDPLGGLLIWSGSLINEAAWTTAANACEKLSIVQSHGRLDPILPFAGAEFLRDMLVSAGHQVKFIAFDDQHTISPAAITASSRLVADVVTGALSR